MSRNLDQVYNDNPIVTNQDTDLMYFGRSPYGNTDDCGMLYSDFAAQLSLYMNYTQFAFVGTTSFIPNDKTKYLIVEIYGGGGGGWTGLATDSTHSFVSSAGGNGGFIQLFVTGFDVGYEFGITVGSGGTAASSDNVTPPGLGHTTKFGDATLFISYGCTGGNPGFSSGLITAATTTQFLLTGDMGGFSQFGNFPFTAQVTKIGRDPKTSMGWVANSNNAVFNEPPSLNYNTFGKGGSQQGLPPNSSAVTAVAGMDGAVVIYEFG